MSPPGPLPPLPTPTPPPRHVGRAGSQRWGGARKGAGAELDRASDVAVTGGARQAEWAWSMAEWAGLQSG